MHPTTQKGNPSRPADQNVRHLFQHSENPRDREIELVPFFCVEARIDFNDIRTGFRETVSLSKALEIYSDNADLLWTDDMIRDVDFARTSAHVPVGARLAALPDFVNAGFISRMENQFAQYLLRSFEARIFRNFDLNLYSLSGESRPDFCRRCLELFDGPKRREMDGLHEVFIRKLEQTRQKYLGTTEPDGLEQAKAESRNRDAFSRCAERIADLFYCAELMMDLAVPPPQYLLGMQEYEEKLISLEAEAHRAITDLAGRYNEKARAIDEYILHPNLKDIHFVRSCVLWAPKGAA